MRTIVIMPGGFHPFHAGHAALYKSAVKAFNNADVYVAATNDTKTRPFPFAIKEKLAKLAGVADKHFVQVKSPFQAKEITQHYNPDEDVLVFVRSEKDKNEQPKPGGTKKDGSPSYFQPWTGKNLQPFSKHAYIAYLPTVEFGPGITSASEIRDAWPTLNDKRKTAMVMSLYPVTQKNPKLAANVVKMLDMGMGNEVAEGSLNEFAPPGSDGGGDSRSRRIRKLLEIAIQVAKEKNIDELGMIHGMNMIAGDDFFNTAVEGILSDITDKEYMFVLQSAYKTVKQGLAEAKKKRKKKSKNRSLGRYFFPGYSYYGGSGESGEGGGDGGGEGMEEGKITLSTDPNWYGATVDNYQASGPVVNIPANQLVGFEPDDKMNQPKSKVNVEKIVAGLKQGAKLPPLLVRKYKNGYQVLDGHHRFWAYKLLGVKSIPAQIVPDSDIEEISKQGVAEGLNEAVGGNYLYHATMPAGIMRILRSGIIKATDRPQSSTKSKTQYPTISTTRSKQYAESNDFVDFLNLTKDGNSVILVFDRTAVANHYKMFSTSQGTQTVGDEYEEVIVAPKGSMPIKGTLKGFYFNPRRTEEIEGYQDVPWFNELLNSPYYMGQKQGVAEGLEEITEYRDRMYQYIKSIVPGFPDYVVKDWLYANFARGATQGPNWSFDTIGKDIPNILKDMGLSVDTKWQLVPNMKFTMDMWEPKTLKRLQARAGGSSKSTEPDVHIPARDAERHATQAQLAQQQGGVRKEPVILIKTSNGYELLEGWHRTIQHFAKYPDGYTGSAYVAVAQNQQGMAEGEEITEGPFVQRIMHPKKVSIYLRLGKGSKLVATDIPYEILDSYVKKVIQKYPQFKPTDFSFKSSDKVDENLGIPYPTTYEQENNKFKRRGPMRITAMTEFATPGSDDREPDEEEILRQLAAQWWNGSMQQMKKAQQTLQAMGWEIGQDESGDDDAGVFVIRIGDEHGDSYIAFPHSELGLNEDYLNEK